jgi:hypothetical protein
MECEEGKLHKDEFNNSTIRSSWFAPNHERFTQLRLSKDASNFEVYAKHVENYSSRCLSFRSDVYAAFSGILTSLFGSELLHYGLPSTSFDLALHWYPLTDNLALSVREPYWESGFPSWSWYSRWSSYDRISHAAYGFCGALTAWYYHEVASNTLSVLNTQCDSLLVSDWRFYMAIACEAGCVLGSSTISRAQETISEVCVAPVDHRLDYSTFCQELGVFKGNLMPGVQHIMQDTPSAILGHVQSTFLDLEGDPSQRRMRILGSHGRIVGYLEGFRPKLIKQWGSQDTSSVEANRRFEFVGTMLRVSEWRVYDTRENWNTKGYVQGKTEWEQPVPLVSVMLIAWDGPVAYRRALGWVYLKDWIAAPRTWRTIILK